MKRPRSQNNGGHLGGISLILSHEIEAVEYNVTDHSNNVFSAKLPRLQRQNLKLRKLSIDYEFKLSKRL